MSLVEMIDSLIDEVGSGLNAATIRSRLLTLREQAEAVDAALQRAEADLERLKAAAQTPNLVQNRDVLEEDAVRFLQLLFEGAELSVPEIAAKLGISKGMAEYHCGVLSEKQMIHPMSIGIVMGLYDEPTPTTWIITSKGREYLVKNKLVS